MSTATYARFEVLRTFRNARFFVFSLVFPLRCTCHRRRPTATSTTSPGRASRRRSTTWPA